VSEWRSARRKPLKHRDLWERLLELNLAAEAPDRIEGLEQVVAGRAERAQPGDLVHQLQCGGETARTAERRARPRADEIADAGQRPAGAAKAVDRARVARGAEGRAARSPQRSSNTLCRSRQHVLQPGTERSRVHPRRLGLGEHRKQRVDAGLDRTLAQQLGAETMNGVDMRLLERAQRLFETVTRRDITRPASLDFDRFT